MRPPLLMQSADWFWTHSNQRWHRITSESSKSESPGIQQRALSSWLPSRSAPVQSELGIEAQAALVESAVQLMQSRASNFRGKVAFLCLQVRTVTCTIS